jgi:tripartite-type tricarboxylate transporter receptor subunit TctC
MAAHAYAIDRALSRREALGLVAAAGPTGAARAQQTAADWPTKPVRYIELFGPGSPTDLTGRAWCAAMGELTGQQFVVDNRPGAGGTLGTAAIARATPDGYTIGTSGIGQLAVAPALYARLPYDPARDLTLISGLWRQPIVLLANKDLPARSVEELIALLRREPGRHLYGHPGPGTSPHLAVEMFKTRAEVALDGVPYSGPQMRLDLAAGRLSLGAFLLVSVLGSVREGQFRALAVTGPERSPAAPEIPALAEILPGFSVTSWSVLAGPAGLPAPLVERMHALSRRALERPEVGQRFQEAGNTPWPAAPAELAAYRAEQAALLAPIVRASGARIE